MAVGVPVNSLQDLLLLRELRNQADPFRSGMQALAQGVGAGIEAQREEAKAKKKEAEGYAKALEAKKQIDATNKGKMVTKMGYSQQGGWNISQTPIKTTAASIAKERPVFKEARDLGISTLNKSEEEVNEEVTQYHRDQSIKYEEEFAGIDEKEYTTEFVIGKDGKKSLKYKPLNKAEGAITEEQLQQVLDGMESGTVTPSIRAYSRTHRTILAAEAQRRGLNLQAMESEENAVDAWVRSSNSTSQVKLRQVIDSVLGTMGELRGLNKEFKRTGWTPANAAEIKLAVSGTNPAKRDIATKYTSLAAMLRSEMGQIFMGGNSPTDRALQLAEEALNTNYGFEQMNATLDTLEDNIQYRLNSINNSGPQLRGGELPSSPFLAEKEGAFGESEQFKEDSKKMYNRLRSQGHSIEFSKQKAGL